MTGSGAPPPSPGDSGPAAGYIARWRPSSVSAEAAAFARDVVTQAGPLERERAKNLLWAAGKLADYALGLGLETVPEAVLHPSTAERFTRCTPGLSGPARRTLRTNLRFIGRRVVPQFYPQDLPLPRERSKRPYSPAEIGGFLALADAQPTAERRMRAAALVCLGAGAGLIRGDLRDVRGTDIGCRSGGVVVDVRGPRPRAVPVLSQPGTPGRKTTPAAPPGACPRKPGAGAAKPLRRSPQTRPSQPREKHPSPARPAADTNGGSMSADHSAHRKPPRGHQSHAAGTTPRHAPECQRQT